MNLNVANLLLLQLPLWQSLSTTASQLINTSPSYQESEPPLTQKENQPHLEKPPLHSKGKNTHSFQSFKSSTTGRAIDKKGAPEGPKELIEQRFQEQVLILSRVLVSQGHLPASLLHQPPAVFVPQTMICLKHLYQKGKKEKRKEGKEKKGGKLPIGLSYSTNISIGQF